VNDVHVRNATVADREWLRSRDIHVASEAWLDRCLNLGDYLIAERGGGESVGFLRYSWFWGVFPYMDMIRIDELWRGKGIGAALVRAWEAEMRSRGVKLLMASSQSDEPEPQAFHRRNGFVPSGQISFAPEQMPAEIFMTKVLSDG
jgi:GNAT superfamily N-acetyltransferase